MDADDGSSAGGASTDLFRAEPAAGGPDPAHGDGSDTGPDTGPDTGSDTGSDAEVPAPRRPPRAGAERLVTPGGYVVEPRPVPAHLALPTRAARLRAAAVVVTGVLLVAGVVIATRGADPVSSAGPSSAGPTAAVSAVAAPAVAAEASPAALADAAPASALRATDVALPTIGVRSTLVALDVGPDGALQAPADPAVAGWYVRGAVPGEPGPTVLAGHVDSRSGPAVFYRLDELRPGDRVEVTRSDGQVFGYRVATVETHPKTDFPTARVYGPTPGPELRLITCGGDFDRRSRHYRDNVVVTAIPA